VLAHSFSSREGRGGTEYRQLGRTGWKISAIGIGTWAMGSAWGATRAADLPALSEATMAQVREIYDRVIRPLVESRW